MALEKITEINFEKAKHEAKNCSTRNQNYHCMLSGWVGMYVSGGNEKSKECKEVINKIFSHMEEEKNISESTIQIYRSICDFLMITADNKKREKFLEVSQKYLN